MEEEARDSSHSPEPSAELQPTLAATRTRRSAAAASSRAWAPLLAGKKGLDVSDTEENEKATPVAGKSTETQGGSRKRGPGRPRKQAISTASSETKSPPPQLSAQNQNAAGVHEQSDAAHDIQQGRPPNLKVQGQVARSNYSALNKEQLEQIEREVQKHQYSTEGRSADEDEDYDDEEERYNLDEDSDVEWGGAPRSTRRNSGRLLQRGGGAGPSQGPRAGAGALAATRGAPPVRAPGFSSGAGIVRPQQRATSGFRPAQPVPPSLSQPRRIVVNGHGPMTTVYSSQPSNVAVRRANDAGGSGGYKVLRITRPVGQQPPPLGAGFRSLPQPPQQQPPQSVAAIDQDIQEISVYHAQHVINGSRIQDFNQVIEDMNVELNRVIADRNQLLAGHREYIEQMNLSHATALDIKDSRIRQLEQAVADLQNKLQAAYKRLQLQTLRQETEDDVHGGRLLSESSNAGEGESSAGGYHTMQKMEIESPNKILRSDPMMSRQPVDSRYHVVQQVQHVDQQGRQVLSEFIEQEFAEGEMEIGHEMTL